MIQRSGRFDLRPSCSIGVDAIWVGGGDWPISQAAMRSFKGKKALVTGAASGIGRAIALALAAEGAVLRLLDIDASGLGRTAEEVRAAGAEAATMVCDLASAEQVSGCVSRILTDDADLSILINAAGIAHYGPLHLAADGWDRVIAVNLTAPI